MNGEAIIDTYMRRLPELTPLKQRHFLYRAAHVSPRADVHEAIANIAIPYTRTHELPRIDAYTADKAAFLASTQEIAQSYVCKKMNDAHKKEQWLAVPPLHAYNILLWSLYYLEVFGIDHALITVDSDEILQLLQTHPRYMQYATVYAINTTYHLHNQGLGDIRDAVHELFTQNFPAKTIASDPELFHNYIYGLTHIVIGSSNFYQKNVQNAASLAWVQEALHIHADAIFDTLTLDINAEVALCLCMLGESMTSPFCSRVMTRLARAFSPEDGYIHREEDNSFEFAEHTNAVALLLSSYAV